MRSIAVMQPYIFPYLGYYQLLKSVDEFIFFDDVDFIKKGWIHRNAILSSQRRNLFSVPLKKASQNKSISKTEIHAEKYHKWWSKFEKNLWQNYHSSPQFEPVFNLIEGVFENPGETIAELSMKSVEQVSAYLGLYKKFAKSSDYINTIEGPTPHESGQEKIIDLCRHFKAGTYRNMIGGEKLYDEQLFIDNHIKLEFIEPHFPEYDQQVPHFENYLSIIDILMFNSKAEVRKMLNTYTLKTKSTQDEKV